MTSMKIRILTDVRERNNYRSGKIYLVTAINDKSEIVTCFLPEMRKELFVNGYTYIVRGIRSWVRGNQLCIQCNEETKVTSSQSNYGQGRPLYFHPVSSSFFFFPRLISAVGDWMFTILWHMVWP